MEGAPNLLASLALILCPLVSIALIAMMRAQIAVPIIILGGVMFLPPNMEFHIPSLPPFDKQVIPAASAMLGCLIFRRKVFAHMRPGRSYDLFIVTQVVGLLGTGLTNMDALVFGPRVLPGLVFTDFVGQMNILIFYWFPIFFLGRALFRTRRDLETLLVVTFVSGIIYAPFVLLELRFSPQMNMWIYGYHQSGFNQTVRASGYRPMVFMRHGLNLALFLVMTIVAGSVLVRLRRRVAGLPARPFVFFLIVVLLLCKSAGSIIYMIIAAGLVSFTRPKTQIRWARVLAVIIFAYPVLRMMDLVPIDSIKNAATSLFGPERADSMMFRTLQEGNVLDRAMQRILFGWGGYGRPFMHDPITGDDRFTVDGYWAVQLGSRGIVGYVAVFGMLLLPVWRSARTYRRLADPGEQAIVAGLALMSTFYVGDLIQNASLDTYLTFLVGALAGTERWLPEPPDPALVPDPADPYWAHAPV